MEYADQLTIFGLMMSPLFLGFVWGRWERMTADILEEIER